jgi:hypothetical protein
METRLSHIQSTLSESEWTAAQQAHEDCLRPVLDPYLEARSRGAKNPVLDFLFEYYAFRPSHLLRWSPGLGVALAGTSAQVFLEQPEFAETSMGIALDPARFPERRKEGIRWIREVLAATQDRAPFLGCHGMHEWAMVYRADAVRHHQVPLRLPPAEIAAAVEARPVVCTHFDAFRFFTPEARPLNHHQPTRATMPALEQPGCLHTNMDLYKWAYKLHPWLPGDLLADAFLLACRIREVDMRASPYDLRDSGLAPIPIEHAEGRRQYQCYQQQFMEAAAPLRSRMLAAYDALITWF